jgi:hypothetical protein
MKSIFLTIALFCGMSAATCKADFDNFNSNGGRVVYVPNGPDFDVYDSGKLVWYLHPTSGGSYDIYDARTSKYLGYLDTSGVYILKEALKQKLVWTC